MRITTIILPILLAACAHVNPQTALSLATLSPLTADPDDFRAAIDLPTGVDVAPDGAVLTFSAERADTGASDKGVFVLEMLDTTQGMKLFRLAAKDRAEYIRLRDLFAAWEKQNETATRGQFSIAIAACRHGQGPAADATFSVFIATTENGRFAPLIKNAPISDALALVDQTQTDQMCD